MGEALESIGAYISLILITIFAWTLYTAFIMAIVIGIGTILDVVFGHFVSGNPFPDWWWVLMIMAGIMGAYEFYENIVRGV